jgi:hypothetical protein
MIFLCLMAVPAFAQSVTKVSLADPIVVSGLSTTGTVTLSGPAPTSGYTVTMLYGPYASGPAKLTVPSNQTSITFRLIAKAVNTNRTQTVMAQGADGSSVTTSCVIIPPTVQRLEMSAPFVMAGQSATATLTLAGIPVTSGLVVNLTSSDPNFTVPATVTVPWPSQTATFTVNAVGGIGSIKSTVITATYGKDKVTATLTAIPTTVLPDGLQPGTYRAVIDTANDPFSAWLYGSKTMPNQKASIIYELEVLRNATCSLKLLWQIEYFAGTLNGAWYVYYADVTSQYNSDTTRYNIPGSYSCFLNGPSPYLASMNPVVMAFYDRNSLASYSPPSESQGARLLQYAFVEFFLSFTSIAANSISITLNQSNRVFGLGGDSLQPGDHSATITLTKVY